MPGAAFSLEVLAVTLWLDNSVLIGRHGFSAWIGSWGAWILRASVALAVFFFTFLGISGKARFEVRPNRRFLAAHVGCLALFAALSSAFYGAGNSPNSDVLAAAWVAAGLGAVICGAFTVIPPGAWVGMFFSTGYLWLIATTAVLLACITGNASRSLWPRTATVTFQLTHWLVSWFIPQLIVDPAKKMIGTPGFLVQVAPECSGLEGIGLILAFGVTWLILYRKQCRFPQALLLLPAGAVLIFLLNSVRIAALILIGNAGAERIAAGGFHSQAGWILFNVVALGFTTASGRLPWVARQQDTREAAHNPVAAWLLPFVAILAAGMLSRALTGDFEWTYPLRFFAAAGVLLYYRRSYAEMNWCFDWFGPAMGVGVFLLWIGLDRLHGTAPQAMPAALAAASPLARNWWLLFRVAAAVVTVPIAEELAFRGFLYRRFQAAEFETVPLRRFAWPALLASSIIFGLLHGSRWIAGTLAGAAYGLALLRRGRVGDAVAAHATTNALLAFEVLARSQWSFW